MQTVGLAVDLLEGWGFRRQDTVDQPFHRALNGGQRRAQFVGHVADEFPARGFDLFQFGRHLVEADGQLGQFVQFLLVRTTRYSHTLIVVPVGDAAARDHHLAHGGNDSPTDEQADNDG